MTRGKSTKCGSSGSQNHGRSKSQRRKNLKCYNYGMKRHLKKDCWHKKSGGENSGVSTSQGCVAITSDNADVLCNEVAIGSRGGRQLHDCWILDLGALDT